MDYWEDCITEAFEDAKILATKEQIDTVISWVEGAYENYGMATGSDRIPNPDRLEIEKLKKELTVERKKITCDVCEGRGRIVTNGPCHSSSSGCYRCRGEGRHVR